MQFATADEIIDSFREAYRTGDYSGLFFDVGEINDNPPTDGTHQCGIDNLSSTNEVDDLCDFESFYEVAVEGESPVVQQAPLLVALAKVGVMPIGAQVPVAETVLFDRDFSSIQGLDFGYAGEIVASWDLPSVGADTLMRSQMANIQINGLVTVVHGNGDSAVACNAIREKIDGLETVQVVATTSTGQSVALLWNSEEVRRVEAEGSAHYERVQDEDGQYTYVLLSGTPSPSIRTKPHLWMPITQESVASLMSTEGAIVMSNCIQTRVKVDRTVTLRKVGNRFIDSNNNAYAVSGCPPEIIEGCVEVAYLALNKLRFLHPRRDRLRPDSKAVITTVVGSAVLADLLQHAPISSECAVPSMRLICPRLLSPTDHRIRAINARNLGPYSWARADGSSQRVEFMHQLARSLCKKHGYVDDTMIRNHLRISRQYASGQKILSFVRERPGFILRLISEIGVLSCSTHPMVGMNRVYVTRDRAPVLRYLRLHAPKFFCAALQAYVFYVGLNITSYRVRRLKEAVYDG